MEDQTENKALWFSTMIKGDRQVISYSAFLNRLRKQMDFLTLLLDNELVPEKRLKEFIMENAKMEMMGVRNCGNCILGDEGICCYCQGENFHHYTEINDKGRCKNHIFLEEAVKAYKRTFEYVQKQAVDKELWSSAMTCCEGYLQKELRELHRRIEGVYYGRK